MSAGDWASAARALLAESNELDLYRERRLITPIDATHIFWNGRDYVNFASNNYLGLSFHPEVIAAADGGLREGGAGSGASALITGYGPAHAAAEQHIGRWKGAEACVLLPSGYQANHAAAQTLAAVAEKSGRKIRFLLDKLCHASLIDAVRGSGMPFRIYPHNQTAKLQRLLEGADADEIQVVVTESIFSMDGDAADLAALARLKEKFSFMLLLDEAHATGVYGTAGSGLANELGLKDAIDVTVLTLSKGIGCAGGAVCASATFCRSLVNFARAYVYSTSLPPVLAAAADAAVSVMEQSPERQARLRSLSQRFRQELVTGGVDVPAGDSPIIPIILGSESAALEAANGFVDQGLLVLAIRPPTVPRGSSRLRITLSSEHTDAETARLIRAIREMHP